MNNEKYWYNFRTKEYEYVNPSDLRDYIPQSTSAQKLYSLYIETGDSPMQAAAKVLEISIGIKPDEGKL